MKLPLGRREAVSPVHGAKAALMRMPGWAGAWSAFKAE